MFAGSIYYVATDNNQNLNTTSFTFDGTTYDFYVIGIAFVLLQLSIFFYMISLRLV